MSNENEPLNQAADQTDAKVETKMTPQRRKRIILYQVYDSEGHPYEGAKPFEGLFIYNGCYYWRDENQELELISDQLNRALGHWLQKRAFKPV